MKIQHGDIGRDCMGSNGDRYRIVGFTTDGLGQGVALAVNLKHPIASQPGRWYRASTGESMGSEQRNNDELVSFIDGPTTAEVARCLAIQLADKNGTTAGFELSIADLMCQVGTVQPSSVRERRAVCVAGRKNGE